ncbi:endonuclease/exonuclease/phosphatase family protein [Candidatus Saccharibacteria bacterium]|nr:endonuclease/exonuclease/phosphatase family protein [Candidatus Saccharibacteria bacterium]MBR0372516.1 endonuclease/exonuclease/phosphatase family protein [Candidatus Saccharibacteria bacterium]
MKLKVASYNISGGFYENEKTEYLDKKKSNDIDLRLLNDIIKIVNEEKIDIVCFQEIITTKRINYINRIIEKTDLKYEEHFELSPCDAVEDTECGIAILSKYPIKNSVKKLFTNPMLSKTTSSGNTYYTFDKGLLLSEIDLGDKTISILNHHNFPFRRFNSTPEENKDIFVEFDNEIEKINPDIITGDFNAENFINLMPYTKENYIKTIDKPTTDDGAKFDDLLIHDDIEYSSKIIESLSDHFMIIIEINL